MERFVPNFEQMKYTRWIWNLENNTAPEIRYKCRERVDEIIKKSDEKCGISETSNVDVHDYEDSQITWMHKKKDFRMVIDIKDHEIQY